MTTMPDLHVFIQCLNSLGLRRSDGGGWFVARQSFQQLLVMLRQFPCPRPRPTAAAAAAAAAALTFKHCGVVMGVAIRLRATSTAAGGTAAVGLGGGDCCSAR
jgi:hypothetical protein